MTIKFNNVGGNIEITTDSTRIYYGGAGTSGNFKPIDTNRGGELNGFLITLGGDCYSVAFDDLRINGYSPTTLLIAAEALQGLFSNTPYTPPPLILEYNNPANIPDYTLADWNEFFHLGGNDYYGIPFTSVAIEGANVLLRGGKDITLRENLYQDSGLIVDVTDNAYCVTSAENKVFNDCANLIGVYLPLLKTARDSCFSNCTSIPFFDKLPSLITAGNSCFSGCTSATSFDLPSLQDAGERCFYSCTSAISFNLPSLQTAGNGCFAQSTSATSFNLPLLQSAGNGCFRGCTSATSFDLPLLVSAGDKSFIGCTSATNFNLPLLQSAGGVCFGDCASATSFDFPLLTIAEEALFANCTSATAFNLPLVQRVIGNECFTGCTSATLFNLPSVIQLGYTTGDNAVFANIVGNTISLTILPFLMVCNEGQPDGDIVYLQDNNDVTITLV